MESMKRENYDLLESIAKPVLDDKAYYMQLSSVGMMDLNVEKVMDDIYAISHYGTLNGDAMADPDVEIKVDLIHRTITPVAYQNDYVGMYQRNDSNEVEIELNEFINEWLKGIKNSQYKVTRILTDENEFNVSDNPKELLRFCRENGVGHLAAKQKNVSRNER